MRCGLAAPAVIVNETQLPKTVHEKADLEVQAAGWNFFFMASEVKVMFFGAIGAKKVRNALMRILAKVKRQSFNALEVTGIVAKRFLSVPYATVSAHSRDIQQTCRLGGRKRTASVSAANEWARG